MLRGRERRSYEERLSPGTAVQRSCVCPIPGGAQAQVGWALCSLSWWVATSPWQEMGTE